MGISLACQPNRRRIHDRHHFGDMVAQHEKEQRFVAVVQSVECDEFFERVGQLAQAREYAHRLFFLGMHMRRQEAAQFVHVALRFGEAGAAVEGRVAQQRETGLHCFFPVGVGLSHDEQLLLLCLSLLMPPQLGATSPRRRSMERRAAAPYLLIVFELSALRLIWINKVQSDER